MKRKRQESIIKLAFSEYSSETERKALEEKPLGSEGQKEFELMSSIRENLKKTGQATPECSLSIDRVRDAILNQNISQNRNSTTFWSWASVAVAACAFVFVLNSNRHQTAEPRFVANVEKPSIFTENNPLQPNDTSSEVAVLLPPDFAAEPERSVETPVKPTPVRAANRNTQWADITTTVATTTTRAVEQAMANRNESLRNARSGETQAIKALDLKADSMAPKPEAEPIILIDSNTDNDTGAQVATEVESVENVHIGG